MFLIDSFGIGIIMSRTYALHRDAAMPTDRAISMARITKLF